MGICANVAFLLATYEMMQDFRFILSPRISQVVCDYFL